MCFEPPINSSGKKLEKGVFWNKNKTAGPSGLRNHSSKFGPNRPAVMEKEYVDRQTKGRTWDESSLVVRFFQKKM